MTVAQVTQGLIPLTSGVDVGAARMKAASGGRFGVIRHKSLDTLRKFSPTQPGN